MALRESLPNRLSLRALRPRVHEAAILALTATILIVRAQTSQTLREEDSLSQDEIIGTSMCSAREIVRECAAHATPPIDGPGYNTFIFCDDRLTPLQNPFLSGGCTVMGWGGRQNEITCWADDSFVSEAFASVYRFLKEVPQDMPLPFIRSAADVSLQYARSLRPGFKVSVRRDQGNLRVSIVDMDGKLTEVTGLGGNASLKDLTTEEGVKCFEDMLDTFGIPEVVRRYY